MTSSLGAAAANPTQVVENLPSSLVGLASALPGGATEQKPNYGLSMRFRVRVLELNADLGEWASCQGLKVDFNPVAVASGGEYTSVQYLPGEMKYPRVVLKRAVDPESSRLVQQWLRDAAASWLSGERDNVNPGNAKITLLNADDDAVMSWTLDKVRPAAWIGPDLDANSSKVAIETLELVHSGFQVEVSGREQPMPPAPQPPAPPDNLQRCTLTGLTDNRSVQFHYRPERIGVKRTTEPQSFGTTSGGVIDAGDRPDITVLVLSKLVIAGADTRQDVEQLLKWGTKELTGDKDLPKLKLVWGLFDHQVKIKTVDVTYTRFDSRGKPVRADVQLTLYALESQRPGNQNPSSGGIPGRGAHTLVQSENLQQLATQHYGSAAHWRDIADANGIDDPLRVRPGVTLFLPAETELSRNGGRR